MKHSYNFLIHTHNQTLIKMEFWIIYLSVLRYHNKISSLKQYRFIILYSVGQESNTDLTQLTSAGCIPF